MTVSKFPTPIDRLQSGTIGSSGGPRFIIGRGRRGGWIVNDRLGLVGGIFVSETAARHFAFEESGGRTEQIVVVAHAEVIDLDLRRIV